VPDEENCGSLDQYIESQSEQNTNLIPCFVALSRNMTSSTDMAKELALANAINLCSEVENKFSNVGSSKVTLPLKNSVRNCNDELFEPPSKLSKIQYYPDTSQGRFVKVISQSVMVEQSCESLFTTSSFLHSSHGGMCGEILCDSSSGSGQNVSAELVPSVRNTLNSSGPAVCEEGNSKPFVSLPRLQVSNCSTSNNMPCLPMQQLMEQNAQPFQSLKNELGKTIVCTRNTAAYSLGGEYGTEITQISSPSTVALNRVLLTSSVAGGTSVENIGMNVNIQRLFDLGASLQDCRSPVGTSLPSLKPASHMQSRKSVAAHKSAGDHQTFTDKKISIGLCTKKMTDGAATDVHKKAVFNHQKLYELTKNLTSSSNLLLANSSNEPIDLTLSTSSEGLEPIQASLASVSNGSNNSQKYEFYYLKNRIVASTCTRDINREADIRERSSDNPRCELNTIPPEIGFRTKQIMTVLVPNLQSGLIDSDKKRRPNSLWDPTHLKMAANITHFTEFELPPDIVASTAASYKKKPVLFDWRKAKGILTGNSSDSGVKLKQENDNALKLKINLSSSQRSPPQLSTTTMCGQQGHLKTNLQDMRCRQKQGVPKFSAGRQRLLKAGGQQPRSSWYTSLKHDEQRHEQVQLPVEQGVQKLSAQSVQLCKANSHIKHRGHEVVGQQQTFQHSEQQGARPLHSQQQGERPLHSHQQGEQPLHSQQQEERPLHLQMQEERPLHSKGSLSLKRKCWELSSQKPSLNLACGDLPSVYIQETHQMMIDLRKKQTSDSAQARSSDLSVVRVGKVNRGRLNGGKAVKKLKARLRMRANMLKVRSVLRCMMKRCEPIYAFFLFIYIISIVQFYTYMCNSMRCSLDLFLGEVPQMLSV